MLYQEINACRLCSNTDLRDVFNLGEQTLTGVFPSSSSNDVPTGPVTLTKCNDVTGCGLVQLKQTYNPDMMYGENYGYRSSLNISMVQHLKTKVEKIEGLGLLNCGDVILDIGCNDGTTLKLFDKKYTRIGIDPSAEKFLDQYPPDIRVNCDFFSADAFKKISLDAKAKVITSFSMFYDLPDPLGFAKDIASCLRSDGIWVFEQSYLPEMLKTNSFDTICHEHLEFYSLKQILYILERASLKCIDVEFNKVNGGSFSIVAAHQSSNMYQNVEKINKIEQKEINDGIHTFEIYNTFKKRVDNLKSETKELIKRLNQDNISVYGIGASTKGNVLLQHYKLDEYIKSIGEVNSEKFGMFTPGSGIPIIPENEVLKSSDAYFLILPWHFKEFFLQSSKFRGKNLIFPLPDLEIVHLPK